MIAPYNYVISPYIRKTCVGLKIKQSIVIFDEGHNLENTAEDVCSFKLSIEHLKFTIKAN